MGDGFDDLVGRELSGVAFVRGYIQLQFDPPPIMNVGTPVTVGCGPVAAALGTPAFANLLIDQVGKAVTSVELRSQEALRLIFADESFVSASLKPQDYVGPEAINLLGADGSVAVL